jgi:hypothetical protein
MEALHPQATLALWRGAGDALSILPPARETLNFAPCSGANTAIGFVSGRSATRVRRCAFRLVLETPAVVQLGETRPERNRQEGSEVLAPPSARPTSRPGQRQLRLGMLSFRTMIALAH